MRTTLKLLVAGAFIALLDPATSMAATLDQLMDAADQINQDARASQNKVEAIADKTRDLLNDYKNVLKETDGLRVYNGQLQKQLDAQKDEMTRINNSIGQVTVIERQITPMMLRMIAGLKQMVELDAPFLTGDRQARIARLEEMMDLANISVSEKLSQIFNAYQIENDYGRSMQSYTDTIDGKSVDVLRVGRVILAYQTKDGSESSVWNKSTKAWEPLDDSYNSQIRAAIRMANKQLSINLVVLPVSAPEAAQ